jgi:DNA-directed RNA polymerase subunit RPC12/RpoP
MKQYKYRETTREDWLKTIIYVALFIAIITIGAIFLLSAYLYVWLIILTASLILAISLFLLVQWHARNFAYRCLKCGHEFEVSAFTDFISPHGLSRSGGWKYLKCPKCHQRSKATVTVIKKV